VRRCHGKADQPSRARLDAVTGTHWAASKRKHSEARVLQAQPGWRKQPQPQQQPQQQQEWAVAGMCRSRFGRS